MRLVPPFTETNRRELDCLARFAKNARTAIEIGTFMGASASRIAAALGAEGKLWCVDPYFNGEALRSVCLRHLRRRRLFSRVVMIRATSLEAAGQLPASADFIFVDGDHSWRGIEADWKIVLDHLAPEGIACFHDTSPRPERPNDKSDSVLFFEKVIRDHPGFKHLETCCTLNVMQRLRS
jgi:predicted O-methyltransferase YrrM